MGLMCFLIMLIRNLLVPYPPCDSANLVVVLLSNAWYAALPFHLFNLKWLHRHIVLFPAYLDLHYIVSIKWDCILPAYLGLISVSNHLFGFFLNYLLSLFTCMEHASCSHSFIQQFLLRDYSSLLYPNMLKFI